LTSFTISARRLLWTISSGSRFASYLALVWLTFEVLPLKYLLKFSGDDLLAIELLRTDVSYSVEFLWKLLSSGMVGRL